MMKRVALVLGLALFDLPVAVANGVFKCTDSGGVIVYQGSPCGGQHAQVTLVEPRKRGAEAANGAAVGATNSPAEGAPLQTGNGENRSVIAGDELVAGMSDTKVLNMRGWGRPTHIARSRGADGWREDWTYVSRADGATRLVQFVNGKVAGTRSQDAQELQLARARTELQQQRVETPQVAPASPRPQTPAIEIAQESPRPQQVTATGSPRLETQGVDQTARADEAARVVENLARRGPPRTGSMRWERATVDNPAQPPMLPAPLEQGDASRQPPSAPVEPPLRVTPPAPDRETLHIVTTQPPDNAPLSNGAQPAVIVHSSAEPPLATRERFVVQ